MKIACVLDSVSRRAGGLHDSVRRLMQGVGDLGEDVKVFGVEDEYSAEDVGCWQPLPVEVCASRGPRRFGYAPRLANAIEEFAPDLVSCHGIWTYTSVVSSRWRRRTRRPNVIHAHGMLDTWAMRHSRFKKRVAYAAFEHEHMAGAACLRVLAESQAKAERALGLSSPVCVIPNGIDLPAEKSSTAGDLSEAPYVGGRKILLYLGRLHPKKGIDNLLRAWAKLSGDPAKRDVLADDWVLMVAGWDELGHEAHLQSVCTQSGLRWIDTRPGAVTAPITAGHEPQVIFCGPRFGADKDLLYRASDAFILPSYSEGMPMVVLEAWAYGKPVVMTPACNLPDGFDVGAAIRIDPWIDSVEQGLRDLISKSGQELQVMGRCGHALVERSYTWQTISQRMHDVHMWAVYGNPRPDCVILK